MRTSALVLCLLVAYTNLAGAADFPREIRVQLPTEPVSLDPALADDDFSARVIGNLMDGLMGYDGQGKLEPLLAESHKVSGDRKTYTFKLRKGVEWSDGKPVTSVDFALGILRVLDPRTGAKQASMLFPIRGAEAYNKGKGTPEAVGVRSDAAKREVIFELERPTSYFLHLLAMMVALPSRADILASGGGKWPEKAPTTGAYVLDSHVLEQEIHLSPNARYWRRSPRTLPVLFRIMAEESTAQTLFETGKLDIVTRVTPSDVSRWRSKGRLVEFPQAATYFISFNARKAPFDDRETRRGVAGALNREEILAALVSPHREARDWVPPELIGKRKRAGFKPSTLPAASAALAERIKKQPMSVTAAFNANATSAVIMEKLQFDLRKKLGLDVQLSQMDWKTYIAQVRGPDTPQIYRFQRGAPLMDAAWHLVSFKSGDANNPTGWRNDAYDQLVDQINAAAPGAKRDAMIERAERILVEDEAILIPVFYPLQAHLVSEGVKGYVANPLNVAYFRNVLFK